MKRGWHNFKTEQTEWVSTFPVDRAEEFLPQEESVQRLFDCHLKKGLSKEDAFIKTSEFLASLRTPKAH